MSLQTAANTPPLGSSLLRAPIDRRRHRRVDLTLLGRFMRANKEEYPCKLRDISVGGAALIAGLLAFMSIAGFVAVGVQRTFRLVRGRNRGVVEAGSPAA